MLTLLESVQKASRMRNQSAPDIVVLQYPSLSIPLTVQRPHLSQVLVLINQIKVQLKLKPGTATTGTSSSLGTVSQHQVFLGDMINQNSTSYKSLSVMLHAAILGMQLPHFAQICTWHNHVAFMLSH